MIRGNIIGQRRSVPPEVMAAEACLLCLEQDKRKTGVTAAGTPPKIYLGGGNCPSKIQVMILENTDSFITVTNLSK